MTPTLVQKQFDVIYFKEYQSSLLKRNFEKLGNGASRYGYKRGNIVIKVPYNHGGFVDNIMEAYVYRQHRNSPDQYGRFFAPCRLLSNACLMMVFIERKSWGDLPDWAQGMDGGQAGEYKGRLVSYDSAFDITNQRMSALEWASLPTSIPWY